MAIRQGKLVAPPIVSEPMRTITNSKMWILQVDGQGVSCSTGMVGSCQGLSPLGKVYASLAMVVMGGQWEGLLLPVSPMSPAIRMQYIICIWLPMREGFALLDVPFMPLRAGCVAG